MAFSVDQMLRGKSVPKKFLGGSTSGARLWGTESIDNMIGLILDMNNSATRIAGQGIPYILDTIQDSVPYVIKEKIYVEVDAIGEGRYQIRFYSRGEPATQKKTVFRDKESGKFLSAKEVPSLDGTIIAYTEDAIIQTEDEQGEILTTVADLVLMEKARMHNVNYVGKGIGGSGLFQLPKGTQPFSIGEKTFKGGSYISGTQLEEWHNG
jgi:hypothetical protein